MCGYQGKDEQSMNRLDTIWENWPMNPGNVPKRGRPFPVKNGSQITLDGYIRITAGPWRNRMLHRIIADIKWRECHFDVKLGVPVRGFPMPKNLHVHHMDFKKTHCCAENLIIMDEALHLGCNGFNSRRY